MARETRKLTFGEQLKIKRLQSKLEVTPDGPEYDYIQAQIDAIRYGDADDQPVSDQPNPQPNQQKPDNPEQPKPISPTPLDEMKHLSYTTCTELLVMVKVDNKLMNFETFRRKNPDKTVFDIIPDDLSVFYLNHDLYQEMLETDADLDQMSVVKHCARPLSKDIAPIELSILSGLLYAEAEHDPRILNLGCYSLGTMFDCEESGLFDDYFGGVIYNVLHYNMTLEAARAYADEPDEQPETNKTSKPTEEEQPSKPEQDPPIKEGTKEQSNPQSQPVSKKTKKNSELFM